jgi:hypothetical protein
MFRGIKMLGQESNHLQSIDDSRAWDENEDVLPRELGEVDLILEVIDLDLYVGDLVAGLDGRGGGEGGEGGVSGRGGGLEEGGCEG